jgi:hypothetical protein
MFGRKKMFGHDQRGVAALTVVIIVAASTGVAIATPVVVSAAGANPDSPLYGLARLGEQIRMMSNVENLEQKLPTATSDSLDNTRTELELKAEQLEQIVENQIAENQAIKDYENQLREEIENYFATENILVNVDVKIDIEVSINITNPIHVANENELENKFENELENFNKSLSEAQAMLAGAPENIPGRNAAEQQIELAVKLENDAENAYAAGKIWNALTLIRIARVHILDAETILNHASEWEPEFRENWTDWKETWENMKQQWVENMKQQRIEK